MIRTGMYFLMLLLFMMCSQSDNDQSRIMDNSNHTYELKQPTRSIALPAELAEISDLELSPDGRILCLQDEAGIIYVLDQISGNIISKYSFAGKGDFEGIALAGTTAYAATGGGTLFEIENYTSPQPEVTMYQTFLKEENNVEGLCYDSVNQRLLLACKGHPGSGLDNKEFKAVYAFDLTSRQLQEKPAFAISLADVKATLDKGKGDKVKFSPSAIAIHPESGNIFLTASVGNLLVELNAAGKVLRVHNLPPKLFPQPEGIVFDQVGGMFISNEAADGQATILYFGKGN